MWLESVPYYQDWESLHVFLENDFEFEVDLVDSYLRVIERSEERWKLYLRILVTSMLDFYDYFSLMSIGILEKIREHTMWFSTASLFRTSAAGLP